MTTASEHARLVAVLGDALTAGLDDARVRLGPRAQAAVLERTVEVLELGGFRLERDEPEPPSQAEVW